MKSLTFPIVLLALILFENKSVGQNAAFYDSIAISQFMSGDCRSALETYEKAIQLEPNERVLYYNRAVFLEEIGDYGGAIADYLKCIELSKKDDSKIYITISRLKYALKDLSGAMEYLTKGINVTDTTKLKNSYEWTSHLNRCIILAKYKVEMKDTTGALREFDKIIQFSNQRKDFEEIEFNSLTCRSEILFRQMKVKSAHADYSRLKILCLNTQNFNYKMAEFEVNVGKIFLEQKDIEKACEFFKSSQYYAPYSAENEVKTYCK